MITLVLVWMLLLTVAFAMGKSFLSPNRDEQPLLEWWGVALGSAMFGLLATGWLFFAFALFAPLTGLTLILGWGVVLGVSMALFKYPKTRGSPQVAASRPDVSSILLFVAFAAVLAERSTWIGNLNDSGGYHWNIVQWMNEYGVVQGLGLFQLRLATTSSWLALTAAMNAGVLEERVLAIANGAFFLASLGLFFVAALRIYRGSQKQSDWFIAFGLFFLLPTMLRWEMRLSPSPDVPVFLAPLVFSWSLLRIGEAHRTEPHEGQIDPWLFPLVLSILAMTVKLNAVPLAIVGGAAYVLRDFDLRRMASRALVGGSLVALLTLPLVTTSLIATGCVLFPMPVGCFDWASGIGGNAAREYSHYIRISAPWDIKGLLWASGIGMIGVLVGLKRLGSPARWIIFLAIFSILFLLYFAPTSRFGRGYLLLLPALAVAAHGDAIRSGLKRLGRWGGRTQKGIALLVVIAAFVLPLYKDIFAVGGLRIDESINAPNDKRLFWPSRLDYRGKFAEFETGGLRYSFAQTWEATCWNHPIPCASNRGWPLMHEFQLKDPRLGIVAGFVRQ